MQRELRKHGVPVARLEKRQVAEVRAPRPAKSTGKTLRRTARAGTPITPAKGTRKAPGKRGKPSPLPPTVVRIRELDPREKCGPNTRVQRLYRVDALSDGLQKVHLVFLDHHGLYCEHGPACFVVNEVRKRQSLVRTISLG